MAKNITTDEFEMIKKRIELSANKQNFNTNRLNSKEKLKEITVSWGKKHISLNQWYSSRHWSIRNKKAKEWHSFFKNMIPIIYHKFKIQSYNIELKYNSRLDPSNCITMIKLFEDTINEIGIIPNDTKDYCKGIKITPDETMNKFTYKLTINIL